MKIKNAAVCLFFAGLLLVGLLTCADYGVPVDEPSEQIILQENMHEYAAAILGEDSRAAEWYRLRGIDRISQSIEKDHGQAAYYAFMPVLAALMEKTDVLSTCFHAYTWLWFMLGVVALYGFCRETGLSRPVSCMGSLVLYLCPRFFAEGHYNNKDMVLLSLILATLWLGLRFLKQPGFLRATLFSLAGAFAMNTKVVGAMPWGLISLCALILVTADRRWTWRMLGTALWTLASFALFYALLTPALWTDPAGYIRYLLANASGFTRWPGVVRFRGMTFEHAVNPLPRYYLIWMMAVTLPLYVLPLAAAGQLMVLVRIIRQKRRVLSDPVTLALTASSLCWLLPLMAAVILRPLVYNGWRHFYFVYAGVAVLAAHGIGACLRQGSKRGGDCGMQRVFAVGIGICFLWMAYGISANHPNQYGYYNRLGRPEAQEDMELDYWNLSARTAMEALVRHERDESLPLTLGARDVMSWIGVVRSYPALEEENRAALAIEEREDAPYLYANTTYSLLYGVEPPQGYHKLFTIRSYGLEMCTVYEQDVP